MHARCLIAGLFAFTLAGCGQPDPLAYSKASLELHQQQQAVERAEARRQALEPLDRAVAASWRIALALLPLVALGIAVDAYRRRAVPLIRPDERGQLPVVRAQIETGQLTDAFTAALAAFHTAQLAAAQRPVLPTHLTYAPRSTQPQVGGLLESPASAAPPLALPTFASLSDALDDVKRGHLALGRMPGGELLQVPIGRHMLYCGDTRSGKSVSIDAILVQLHHLAASGAPLTLYASDYKEELAAVWGRSALFPHGIPSDPRAIAEMLLALVNGPAGVKQRYQSLRRYNEAHDRALKNLPEYWRATGQPASYSFVLIDELNAALTAAKKTDGLADALRVLLQMGAGAGVFCISGAQYLTSDVLGRDASKQYTARSYFGAWDSTAIRTVFGGIEAEHIAQIRPYIDGTPGRGIARYSGMVAPVAMQGLHVGEGQILDAIKSVTPYSSSATTTPRYDLQQPASTPATTAVECHGIPATTATAAPSDIPQNGPEMTGKQSEVAVTDEERLSIIKAAAPGPDGRRPSRTAICFQVFGTRGGSGYYKVQHVLDAVGM